MISMPEGLKGRGTFRRGVHPSEQKAFSEKAGIEVVPSPAAVSIPVLQNVGAPCEPVVNPKDEVKAGDKIADAEAFISSPLHAPLNGVIGRPGVTTLPNGRHVKTISIKAGEEQMAGEALLQAVFGGDWHRADFVKDHTPDDIVKNIRSAGIVGQGGAAFPTYVKLLKNEKKPVDTILLNGCECEPYLTSDHRLMVEYPEPIISGAVLAAYAAGASQIVIAVESNKMDAVESLQKAASGSQVKIAVVKTQYPMGGEKQTVRAVLDRTIPTGGLPLDVGVVVINVGTAAAVARAVLRGKPLTHRVISVTGAGIREPKNLLAPIGISYGELIDFCGGLKPEAARVIAGGPMMGFALSDFSVPVTKGTSGIVALTEEDVAKEKETTCIRCGRCVDVCPLNLVPTKLALSSRHKDWELARTYHLMACMECGCCAYVCPSGIPLVQLMRMGKVQMAKEK